MNECEVYFGIRGDHFDPAIITGALDIAPSRSVLSGIPTPKFSSWILSTGKVRGEAIDVYDLTSDLLIQLNPKSNKIKALLLEHNLFATLNVVISFSANPLESTPAIGFSQETINFLSTVGASIDIDTYRLES